MPDIFKPGQTAPASGVYKTTHANGHIAPHYVTVLYGDTFRRCLDCSDRVRFELAVSAVHVEAHPAFRRA
jgi:hypothetical protein